MKDKKCLEWVTKFISVEGIDEHDTFSTILNCLVISAAEGRPGNSAMDTAKYLIAHAERGGWSQKSKQPFYSVAGKMFGRNLKILKETTPNELDGPVEQSHEA